MSERGKNDARRGATRVGVMDGAIGGADRLVSLAALFPQAYFEPTGVAWPDRTAGLNILIVAVDASSAAGIEQAERRLAARAPDLQVVVVLHNADVVTTRRLLRDGASDVLPAPVSEPALAVCIERLFGADPEIRSGAPKQGQLVAFLKAGGGVGATALAVQMAALLAAKAPNRVCYADLDLQFGAGALYLDIPDALTIAEVLAAGSSLQETPFATALTAHRSGARVLAAPRDITPLEVMTPQHADMLVAGLKREFALTLVDLPSVWTAWSNRILQLADRIVLVSRLSVPHTQQIKRQLRLISSQGLDDRPLSLALNALSSEDQAQLTVKAAERAIGRSFDAVIPEDRRTMNAAINEGLELAAVRRGTKLEKAIAELAEKVAVDAFAAPPAQGRR